MMLLAVKADCARVKPNQRNQRRIMNPIRVFLLFPVELMPLRMNESRQWADGSRLRLEAFMHAI